MANVSGSLAEARLGLKLSASSWKHDDEKMTDEACFGRAKPLAALFLDVIGGAYER